MKDLEALEIFCNINSRKVSVAEKIEAIEKTIFNNFFYKIITKKEYLKAFK